MRLAAAGAGARVAGRRRDAVRAAERRLELARAGRARFLEQDDVAVEVRDGAGGERAAMRPFVARAVVGVVVHADVVRRDADRIFGVWVWWPWL